MDCFCSWQEGRPLSALTPSLCFLSLLRCQVFCSFVLRKFKGTAKKKRKTLSVSLFVALALFFFHSAREEETAGGKQ